ncbi:transmembrane protein 231 [Triplophysa rosa]|uniref:transmembrane protein 231 n=1 Tax=Triplophysa rosa TaxID=992332 RepID=UPI002546136C|nr:transmembrane protein 231 [Triplophysa rosa]
MAFYEAYSHPALVRYKTNICTRATLFVMVVLCLTYISPLLVAYRSQGFWLKRSTYEEQPVVQFQYDMILIGATNTAGNYVAWSTFPNFNRLVGDNLRIPSVSVQEEDRNQDGKSDFLNLQINIPLKPEEQMFTIQLLLTFTYQLFVCIQCIHIQYTTICLSVFCNICICLFIHLSIFLEDVYRCNADPCICSAFLICARFSAVHQCRSKASPANSSSSPRGTCCLQRGCL